MYLVEINESLIMDTDDLERLQHQVLSSTKVTIESTEDQQIQNHSITHFTSEVHDVSFDITSKATISDCK